MLSTATAPAPRPTYPDASRTLIAADARTRELAEAMVRLNAEGEATEAALLREGFSAHELRHHADAARALANGIFVRHEPPRPSEIELTAKAYVELTAEVLADADAMAARLYGLGYTHDQIARIWPKLMARIARRYATLPIPNAPVHQ